MCGDCRVAFDDVVEGFDHDGPGAFFEAAHVDGFPGLDVDAVDDDDGPVAFFGPVCAGGVHAAWDGLLEGPFVVVAAVEFFFWLPVGVEGFVDSFEVECSCFSGWFAEFVFDSEHFGWYGESFAFDEVGVHPAVWLLFGFEDFSPAPGVDGHAVVAGFSDDLGEGSGWVLPGGAGDGHFGDDVSAWVG